MKEVLEIRVTAKRVEGRIDADADQRRFVPVSADAEPRRRFVDAARNRMEISDIQGQRLATLFRGQHDLGHRVRHCLDAALPERGASGLGRAKIGGDAEPLAERAGCQQRADGYGMSERKAAARDALLVCEGVNRWFDGVHALKDISLEIGRGEIFGLVGPNGSGKTTMVNGITGFYPPQQGRIVLEGQSIASLKPHRIALRGVARTFQNVALFHGMSVIENILLGRHIYMKPGVLSAAFYWFGAQREEVAHREKVEEIIDLLQLESVRDEPVEVIPLGLQKRVELARALAAEPRFLVLDEPMAGMNQEEKEYMVRFILDAHEALDLTILLIEHHMDVVTAVCDRIVVLNNGTKIAEGPPRIAIKEPAVVAAYIGKVDNAK